MYNNATISPTTLLSKEYINFRLSTDPMLNYRKHLD